MSKATVTVTETGVTFIRHKLQQKARAFLLERPEPDVSVWEGNDKKVHAEVKFMVPIRLSTQISLPDLTDILKAKSTEKVISLLDKRLSEQCDAFAAIMEAGYLQVVKYVAEVEKMKGRK